MKAEAAEAQARGILVPVLIEDVKPPLAFCQIQAAHLANWRGEGDHGGFQLLLCTVCGLLESRAAPVCGPRQARCEPSCAEDCTAGDTIYGTPVAGWAAPSPAQVIMSSGIPSIPSRPNADVLAPGPPKRWIDVNKGAIGGAAALVLLGAVLGYALHEPLHLLLGIL